MKNLIPLANLLIIERVPETTRHGLHIPEFAQETNFGIVRGIGKGKTTKNGAVVPIPVKIGNRVMISPGAGRRDIEIDGKKLWLIDGDNILAVMEEEKVLA